MSKTTVGDIGIKRADYKAIKKMDRIQLSGYLSRIWKRGYEAGLKAATSGVMPSSPSQNDKED